MTDNDVWFSVIMLVGTLIMLKMIISGVGSAIKAAHDSKQSWGRNPNGIPPMFQKMTDKAMADRDDLIESLQERIEVLEKIVTDQHNQSRTRELSEEIENLKR